MKISIITINLNNRTGLEKTISSVFAQTYTDVEFIVIDGGSSDGSLELISQWSDRIAHWVSEKDKGVYDAMNKGIKHANGAYLLFLNSGDFFVNANILKSFIDGMKHKADLVYGNLYVKSHEGLRVVVFPNQLRFSFVVQHSLPHPATLIKRSLFDAVGYYDANLKICSDWKFFMLALFQHNATYEHVDLIVAEYNFDGISSPPKNMPVILAEKDKVMRDFFAPFSEDYEDLEKFRNVYNYYKESRRIKLLRTLRILR